MQHPPLFPSTWQAISRDGAILRVTVARTRKDAIAAFRYYIPPGMAFRVRKAG